MRLFWLQYQAIPFLVRFVRIAAWVLIVIAAVALGVHLVGDFETPPRPTSSTPAPAPASSPGGAP